MSIEARIRAEAAALGFSACGFAAATPLPRAAFLDGWLSAGFAGEMRYLERLPERRLNVGGILPGAQTVISLAYPYAPPAPAPFDLRQELRGRIAAYAYGDDYHHVVDQRLARLEALLLTRYPRERTRRYVDTGPVLEREWGLRSGLGWFGKNTMLLSRRAGSYFFLAELMTTLRISPDSPVSSHCGRCTRCQDACPTGALVDGLVLDARRCISYLTIEHRGSIPRELRPHLGAWVFGCDVCQVVCPWNSKAEAGISSSPNGTNPWLRAPLPPRTQPQELERLYPRLPALLALDETGFRARFGRTPIARVRRRGLLRNIAIALGNSRNPAAIPALVRALEDPEPLVRGHVAWALGELGTQNARLALERQRTREPDAVVVAEIAASLARDDAALQRPSTSG